MTKIIIAIFLTLLPASSVAAQASFKQQPIDIGGARSLLILPGSPKASIILMSGGTGQINVTTDGKITNALQNQLVRTRMAYARSGFAVLVLDASSSLTSAVEYMKKIKRPVKVVATSMGALRAARGIASGARPDKLVLTSARLTASSGGGGYFTSILGSPSQLPKTLIIHHRNDECPGTKPAGVQPFIGWAQGKARAVWLSGGRSVGRPCGATSYHGFRGLDSTVVGIVSKF